MPANLSPRAKTTVAAVVAIVMAGVTAYQEVTAGGHFTWWDVLPVAAAVLAVATTDQVDNTITSPKAKAVVHGALSLLAAITATLTTLVGSEPSGVSLSKLLVAGLGTLAVWAYPEAGPQVAAVEREVQSGAPLGAVLTTVAADLSPLMGPDLPATPPATVVRPAEPTPIADAALAVTTATAPMPAALTTT